MKSPNVERLDAISEALVPLLKAQDFRRRGRSFNRPRDGMVDVVCLQMGVADPAAEALSQTVRSLRRNLDGLYAVNVGIHVPEIWETEVGHPIKGTLQDYHCHARTRVGGDFIPLPSIPDAPRRAAEHAADALRFFDRWSRQGLLDGWVAINDGPDAMTGRARLDIAVMLAARGEKDKARPLLRRQREFSNNPGHPAYVEDVARKLAIPLD